jgi:hypothetical protein
MAGRLGVGEAALYGSAGQEAGREPDDRLVPVRSDTAESDLPSRRRPPAVERFADPPPVAPQPERPPTASCERRTATIRFTSSILRDRQPARLKLREARRP